MFNMVTRGIEKPLAEASEEDIRGFVNRLHSGEFCTQRGGKEYSGSTKADAKKFLKQFYKWLEGSHGQYPDKVVWLSTNIAKDEKPENKRVMSEQEAHQLAQAFRKPQDRAMVYLLFDSGFRISELLSVEKRHFTMEEYKEGEKCWWIECTESKTYTRKVPLPLFTDELNRFVESGYYQSLASGDKLIQKQYRTLLKGLKRNSEKVLGERVTPHNFRHSSATLYAGLLGGDHYALCDRYGWDYASKIPKTYIRKSGTRQKQSAQKVVQNQISKTNQRVKELESRLKQMEQVIDNLLSN
jgi:integrase